MTPSPNLKCMWLSQQCTFCSSSGDSEWIKFKSLFETHTILEHAGSMTTVLYSSTTNTDQGDKPEVVDVLTTMLFPALKYQIGLLSCEHYEVCVETAKNLI